MDKPIWTLNQITSNLTRPAAKWSGSTVNYSFIVNNPVGYGGEAAGFSVFSTEQKAAALVALNSWAAVTNLTFVEVVDTSPDTEIRFANTTTGPGQAWAYYPAVGHGGDVWINPNQPSNFQLAPGGYGLITLIHELGHALGLAHPGVYDASQGPATYEADAEYMQDSRQYTVMSYFDAFNTGSNHAGQYAATPLLHDIAAIQTIYGSNAGAQSGDTVYGFNSTAGVAAFDFSVNANPVVAIWDTGGADTLDVSGFATASRIDLNAGTFSDVGGLTGNVAIAFGTLIENAIGGSGNDKLTGNSLANAITGGGGSDTVDTGGGDDTLAGGTGDDTLIGAIGSDTAKFSDVPSNYSLTKLSVGLYSIVGPDGTDLLNGIEYLQFGNAAPVLIDSLLGVSHTITFSEYAVGTVNPTFKFSDNVVSLVGQIVVDGAQPATPAAAANPSYVGPVYLTFQNMVTHVDFVAGYFDSFGSTTVEFIGAGGGVLQSSLNSKLGIVPYSYDYEDGIAAIHVINSTADPAGFSVDTVTFSGSITVPNKDTVSIAAANADQAEGDSGSTPFTFTVTRSGDTKGSASVGWAVAGSGSNQISASDLFGGVFPLDTVTFAAGETSRTITVNINGDTSIESAETFTVTLLAPSAGTKIGTVSATGTVQNDDSETLLAITALSADKPEGDAGTTPFTFTVTRSGTVAGATSVNWAVTGAAAAGTAAATADDFAGGVFPSGTVSFAAGESSQTIPVDVAGDLLGELHDRFLVTLSGATDGAGIKTASAAGVIRNDDAPASLSIAQLNAERAEGSGDFIVPFTFTVVRSGGTAGVVSAAWSVTGVAGDDMAPAGAADFAFGAWPSGTVVFGDGETKQTITLDVLADSLSEANEFFAVTLSTPTNEAEIDVATALGTIIDDDSIISIANTSGNKPEGTGVATPFSFTVTRSGTGAVAQSVAWSVTGVAGKGTVPANGADFVGGVRPSGLLTFGVGQTSKLLEVNVAADDVFELNERFAVILSAPTGGATLGTAAAVSIILNDDTGAKLSIAAASANKPEGSGGGATPYTFTVTRSGNTNAAHSATWAVVGVAGAGTTPAGASDFIGGAFPTGTVAFAAGQTKRTITVDVLADAKAEINERFAVTLSAPTGAATIETATAQGVIINDDTVLSITAVSGNKPEGSGGGTTPFTFTVTRSGQTAGEHSATWSVAGVAGSGTGPADAADFVGNTLPFGTVPFGAGETSKTITVNVAADGLVEINNRFAVTLSAPTNGAVFETATAQSVILNDDTSFSIAAASASKPEGDGGSTAFTYTVTRSGAASTAQQVSWSLTGGAQVQTRLGGNPLTDRDFVDAASGVIFFDRNAGIETDGQVKSWSIFAEQAGGEVKLLVYNDLGSTWQYVGGSALETVSKVGVNTFAIPAGIPVATGAVFGLWYPPGTTPSVSWAPIGTAVNNHDWPGSPIDAARLASLYMGTIPELSGGVSFDGTVWDASARTYSLELRGDTTLNGGDFAGGVLPSGVLTFAAGQTKQTITANVVGDTQVEPDEAIVVTLSNATGGATISTANATGTIADDDAISGGPGNDTLIGTAANDVFILGGGGNDLVTGAGGLDLFQFLQTALGPAATNTITVVDLNVALGEALDLSAIDAIAGTATNNTFTFIGSAAFGGVAGQLRWTDTGSQRLIAGDVNGDAIADLTIVTNAAGPVTTSWLAL